MIDNDIKPDTIIFNHMIILFVKRNDMLNVESNIYYLFKIKYFN